MYIHTYVFIYVSTYVCMYVCVYIYSMCVCTVNNCLDAKEMVAGRGVDTVHELETYIIYIYYNTAIFNILYCLYTYIHTYKARTALACASAVIL